VHEKKWHYWNDKFTMILKKFILTFLEQ